MLSGDEMSAPPGFFTFVWSPDAGLTQIALVYKVPGTVDLAVLPDLFEFVCRGPVVPDAVVLVHIASDETLVDALEEPPAQAAMMRFDGRRLPLLRLQIDRSDLRGKVFRVRGVVNEELLSTLRSLLTERGDDWTNAGLTKIFSPQAVVVSAPAGYAFRKPSSTRSSYFIRADQGLTTSAAVSFVALAIYRKLLRSHRGQPVDLRIIHVDSMSVAATAFALREFLVLGGASRLPQIESFHSYGGMDEIAPPLPGSSLCLISASSSMNLHREWIEQKRVSERDVLTLVTFEDAEDATLALFALPKSARPKDVAPIAKHDIQISGENFFPVNEPPRKVLLTTTHHAYSRGTTIFHEMHGKKVFRVFQTAAGSSKRRGQFVSGDDLLRTSHFQNWVNSKMPHWLKAGTKQIVFQEDESSRVLAQHIGHILATIGGTVPEVLSADVVDLRTIDPTAGLVAVATVVGRGNRLLALSRELRNIHRGPRLYVIGVQVAESEASVATFDRNLKHSSSNACIDVVRMQMCLASDAVEESIRLELQKVYSPSASGVPPELIGRARELRNGTCERNLLLPTGLNADSPLVLNQGFAFWPSGYAAGSFQSEAVFTFSALLQHARTSEEVPQLRQLHSPMLMQVKLDPENFARFNDPLLQACILRCARASELDYRGDKDASFYMRTLLERMASRVGKVDQAELEFLSAMLIRRLQLADDDLAAVRSAFSAASNARNAGRLGACIRFLLASMNSVAAF
jgi:hypothetical protein